MTTCPNQYALDLMAKGFDLIPIDSKKRPYRGYKWKDKGPVSKEQVKRVKKRINWGILTGDKFTIIDIDVKNGDGYKAFEDATGIKPEDIKTYKCETPSGGLHLYFRGKNDRRIGVLPNVDIIAGRGYALTPGCVIKGEMYQCISGDILPVPAWFDKLKSKPKEKIPVDVRSDLIEGNRNSFCASIAGTLRSLGFQFDEMYTSLSAVNENQCSPPLPNREITTICKSICRYEPKTAKAAADFMEINPKQGIQTIRASEVDFSAIKPVPWIIENRYAKGFVSFLSAQGGSGKSLLFLLEAISACTGQDLSGFKITKQCNVWMHNSEDDTNMVSQRLRSMCAKHCVDQGLLDGLHLTSGRELELVLCKSENRNIITNEDLIKDITHFIKRERIELWLVDPLVHMHQLDENDNGSMNALIKSFTRIADSTGCAIGIAHHVSKSEGKARGASALIDAARMAAELKYSTKRNAIELRTTKANLAPMVKTHSYKAIGIDFDENAYPALIHVVDEKEAQAQETDAASLLDIVKAEMQQGDCIKVRDIYDVIENKYPHLHEYRLKEKRKGVRKLKNALGEIEGVRVFKGVNDRNVKTWYVEIIEDFNGLKDIDVC